MGPGKANLATTCLERTNTWIDPERQHEDDKYMEDFIASETGRSHFEKPHPHE